jgi:hypothetical protein
VGWGSLFSGTLLASIVFLTEFDISSLGSGDRTDAGLIAARLREVLWPLFALAVSLTFLLFPTGRLPSRRWLPVAIVVLTVDILDAIIRVARPGPMPFSYGAVDSVGIAALERPLSALDDLLIWLVRLAFPVVAAGLAVRYRAGSLELRQQVKWVVVAGVFAGLLTVVAFVFPDVRALNVLLQLVAAPVVAVSVAAAVLKYRLYEIDFIINRTLVYGAVSAILAGVFAGLSAAVQHVVVALTGQSSELATIAVALTVATGFHPLKVWVQSIVDRRLRTPDVVARRS